MAAMTYYLLKSHESHEKLKQEIRTRYKTLDEINIASTSQLPYLQAVIKEGLRIFPANSQGLPRRSPGISIDGTWVPDGVRSLQSPLSDPAHLQDVVPCIFPVACFQIYSYL